MLPGRIHYYIFLFGSAVLVISLPLSPYLLSVSILLLSANLVTECINPVKLREKWDVLKSRKAVWLLLSIYILHIIWLFNTSDFSYALRDIRIKLPLLALPVIYGVEKRLNREIFRNILHIFIASVLISSLITTYVLLGFSKLDPVDSRYASLFISHIRFSLLVVLSIYTLFYLAFFNDRQIPGKQKNAYKYIMVWFICFLILLQSFTGIVIFLILLPLAIIWLAYDKGNKTYIISACLLSILVIVLVSLYGLFSYSRYARKNEAGAILESKTINNNPYQHIPELPDYENGNKTWIYISEPELRQEWNQISSFKYDSLDRKGQAIKTTLIRYMTSLGLRKDSAGISKLTKEDREMIEKGYTNHLYKNKFALYPRLYELFWGLEKYKSTGNPTGQSLGQRIEYLKTGIHIIGRFFWLGTGTGDIHNEFQNQYEIDDSQLNKWSRHRTHNQFVTFFITFGFIGFLWVLFALFTPPYLEKGYKHFLFTISFLIGLLSMMNEDTLETHIGVTFFAFFYSFFLFSYPEDEAEKTG